MNKLIDLMISKGLVKVEGDRVINTCAFGEEIQGELLEVWNELTPLNKM